MHFPFHPRATLALVPLCLAGLGCAGPAWADYETSRDVKVAAADDSFPSAAEVGLAVDSDSPGDAEK